jgi:hypothetical protein
MIPASNRRTTCSEIISGLQRSQLKGRIYPASGRRQFCLTSVEATAIHSSSQSFCMPLR